MKFTKPLIVSSLCIALCGVANADNDDPMLKAIKARKGEMQVRAFNFGPLVAMAKGKMDYDAELAKKLAANLQTLTQLDNGRMWPKGSGKDAYPDDTTTIPELWSTYPKISEAGKKYKDAVDGMAANAGNGLDALRKQVSAMGKSCKGCHDDFREKD